MALEYGWHYNMTGKLRRRTTIVGTAIIVGTTIACTATVAVFYFCTIAGTATTAATTTMVLQLVLVRQLFHFCSYNNGGVLFGYTVEKGALMWLEYMFICEQPSCMRSAR